MTHSDTRGNKTSFLIAPPASANWGPKCRTPRNARAFQIVVWDFRGGSVCYEAGGSSPGNASRLSSKGGACGKPKHQAKREALLREGTSKCFRPKKKLMLRSCRLCAGRQRARKANHPAVVAGKDRWPAAAMVNLACGDRYCRPEDFFRESPR